MNTTFEDYVAWVDPANNMRLEAQRMQFAAVLEPLRKVGLVQSYLNDERQSPPPTEPRALYVIGAEAAQLAIAMHQSLSMGVVFPAAGNFRTLFELLLSVKLMLQSDTKGRSDLKAPS